MTRKISVVLPENLINTINTVGDNHSPFTLIPDEQRPNRSCKLETLLCLETGQPFLEHYLPAYNFRETKRGTEYKRDPDFPILPPMWSRRDPDDDARFPDVSETPDSGLSDLR